MKKSINSKYLNLIELSVEAGKVALGHFKFGEKNEFQTKSDNSALTRADLEVNNYLVEGITRLYEGYEVISEENDVQQNAAAILSKKVFIIDPLDGTDSFIKGSSEFTINIALKIDQELVLGIIYQPYEDILYFADSEVGVFKIKGLRGKTKISQLLKSDLKTSQELTIIVTRREEEVAEIKTMLLHEKRKINFISVASSIKFCLLCEGEADAYYRAARIKIWDVAAGFAIVKIFGFKITDHQNSDLLKIIFDENYLINSAQNQFRIEPFIVSLQ